MQQRLARLNDIEDLNEFTGELQLVARIEMGDFNNRNRNGIEIQLEDLRITNSILQRCFKNGWLAHAIKLADFIIECRISSYPITPVDTDANRHGNTIIMRLMQLNQNAKNDEVIDEILSDFFVTPYQSRYSPTILHNFFQNLLSVLLNPNNRNFCNKLFCFLDTINPDNISLDFLLITIVYFINLANIFYAESNVENVLLHFTQALKYIKLITIQDHEIASHELLNLLEMRCKLGIWLTEILINKEIFIKKIENADLNTLSINLLHQYIIEWIALGKQLAFIEKFAHIDLNLASLQRGVGNLKNRYKECLKNNPNSQVINFKAITNNINMPFLQYLNICPWIINTFSSIAGHVTEDLNNRYVAIEQYTQVAEINLPPVVYSPSKLLNDRNKFAKYVARFYKKELKSIYRDKAQTLLERVIGHLSQNYPPPCAWALLGLGEIASGYMYPKSEIKVMVLVEEKNETTIKYIKTIVSVVTKWLKGVSYLENINTGNLFIDFTFDTKHLDYILGENTLFIQSADTFAQWIKEAIAINGLPSWRGPQEPNDFWMKVAWSLPRSALLYASQNARISGPNGQTLFAVMQRNMLENFDAPDVPPMPGANYYQGRQIALYMLKWVRNLLNSANPNEDTAVKYLQIAVFYIQWLALYYKYSYDNNQLPIQVFDQLEQLQKHYLFLSLLLKYIIEIPFKSTAYFDTKFKNLPQDYQSLIKSAMEIIALHLDLLIPQTSQQDFDFHRVFPLFYRDSQGNTQYRENFLQILLPPLLDFFNSQSREGVNQREKEFYNAIKEYYQNLSSKRSKVDFCRILSIFLKSQIDKDSQGYQTLLSIYTRLIALRENDSKKSDGWTAESAMELERLDKAIDEALPPIVANAVPNVELYILNDNARRQISLENYNQLFNNDGSLKVNAEIATEGQDGLLFELSSKLPFLEYAATEFANGLFGYHVLHHKMGIIVNNSNNQYPRYYVVNIRRKINTTQIDQGLTEQVNTRNYSDSYALRNLMRLLVFNLADSPNCQYITTQDELSPQKFQLLCFKPGYIAFEVSDVNGEVHIELSSLVHKFNNGGIFSLPYCLENMAHVFEEQDLKDSMIANPILLYLNILHRVRNNILNMYCNLMEYHNTLIETLQQDGILLSFPFSHNIHVEHFFRAIKLYELFRVKPSGLELISEMLDSTSLNRNAFMVCLHHESFMARYQALSTRNFPRNRATYFSNTFVPKEHILVNEELTYDQFIARFIHFFSEEARVSYA